MSAMPAAFQFGRRRERIDWRLLHGVDLDKVVRDTDLDVLEGVVSVVAYGDLDAEGPPGAVADVSLRRLLRLSQLANEYLLHVQDHLAGQNTSLKDAQEKAQKHVAALRLRVAEHKQRSADSRRELRQAQRTIRAFEVLAGKASYHERLPSEDHHRIKAVAHDPSLLWKLERLEHEITGLREDKARLAAEAGQARDLRDDRARLAAEADTLRQALAERKAEAAATSAELARAVEAAKEAEHRAGHERLATALAAERRLSEANVRLPAEVAQMAAARQDAADADARFRRLDEAHTATLAQLAAVRAEAAAASAAAAEARAPRENPHLQQLQRWLADANTELAGLRKRLSDQERERYEEMVAAKEQAARLQATNNELRRRVDELLDQAQQSAAQQRTTVPPQQPQPQVPPPQQRQTQHPQLQQSSRAPEGAGNDWHLSEIARLEREVNRLDKDNDALRAENNRLATLLAEREPLVDSLRDTVDHLQERLLREQESSMLRMAAAHDQWSAEAQQHDQADGDEGLELQQRRSRQRREHSPQQQQRRPSTAKRPRSAHSLPPPRRLRQQEEMSSWHDQQEGEQSYGDTGAAPEEPQAPPMRQSAASQAGLGFPTRVQHPTLLSQSLSGPLEAAAPYLHDASLLPDAQDLGFADLIMPRPRSAAASRPASPDGRRQPQRWRPASAQPQRSPAQQHWREQPQPQPQQQPPQRQSRRRSRSPRPQRQRQRSNHRQPRHGAHADEQPAGEQYAEQQYAEQQYAEQQYAEQPLGPEHIDLQQPFGRQTWSRPASAQPWPGSAYLPESLGPYAKLQRPPSPPRERRAASVAAADEMPQPSEDDKAQFRQDYPCVLRNAPRLGAVSQFPHSPDRFTMTRPEVEAELEAELANEMRTFGIDAAEERLSDSKCRQALAALARRRQEALARRGRGGAAYVNYMATTLPHYLHQAAVTAKQLELRTSAISGYQSPGKRLVATPDAAPDAAQHAAAAAAPAVPTRPASASNALRPPSGAPSMVEPFGSGGRSASLPRPGTAAGGSGFYSPLKTGASLPRASPTRYVPSPLSTAGRAAAQTGHQHFSGGQGQQHQPHSPAHVDAHQQAQQDIQHSSLPKRVDFDAHEQRQRQHHEPEALNNIDAADEDDIPAEAYY